MEADPAPGARQGATQQEVEVVLDWDSLVYVTSVPQSLYCPVCKNVLLTPLQTSCEYRHTLCARCITRALDERLECPVDRSPMLGGLDDCSAPPLLIQQVLDDLEIECPNDGCPRTLTRAMILMHMKEDCLFQLMPCPDAECQKYSRRWELVDSECLHTCSICEHCQESVSDRNRILHLDECSALSHECQFCQEELDVEGMKLHRESCAKRPVKCEANVIGCHWQGTGADLEAHNNSCALAALRPWLLQQTMRIDSLESENRFLRSKIDQSQKMNGDDSVIEVSSGYERDRSYLFHTLETLSNGLETLSASITAMDNKSTHVFMSESMRTKEEVAMMRSGLQSLRMQWHHFVQNTRGPPFPNANTSDRDSRSSAPSSARVSPTRSQTGDSSRVKL